VHCPGMLQAWVDLLDQLSTDPDAWHALPRDVAAWWRRRAQSVPELADGAWVVSGPAAGEAVVTWSSPTGSRTTESMVTDGSGSAHG
jgi:hypothetical protein